MVEIEEEYILLILKLSLIIELSKSKSFILLSFSSVSFLSFFSVFDLIVVFVEAE
jgi:hypothetical protein